MSLSADKSAAMLQLASRGKVDNYLSVNPEISFFKTKYIKHSYFAMESISQTFDGLLGPNSNIELTIDRKGDLIHKTWLELDNVVELTTGQVNIDSWASNTSYILDDVVRGRGQAGIIIYCYKCIQAGTSGSVEPTWAGNILGTLVIEGNIIWEQIGFADDVKFYPSLAVDIYDMIDNISISVGGQIIDTHKSSWLKIVKNLKMDNEKRKILDYVSTYPKSSLRNPKLRVPLHFWFCTHPGNALPLASISNYSIKVHIKFNNTLPTNVTARLWMDYIFVNKPERLQLLTKPRIYIIEQVQSVTESNRNSSERKITTYFNHPIKELIWQFNDNTVINQAVIRINKKDIFKPRNGSYFSTVQRYQYYSSSKQTNDKDIYCYSFGLNPQSVYSSGYFYSSGNSVKILSTQTGTSDDTELTVYGTNYNILSIHNGFAELLYIK